MAAKVFRNRSQQRIIRSFSLLSLSSCVLPQLQVSSEANDATVPTTAVRPMGETAGHDASQAGNASVVDPCSTVPCLHGGQCITMNKNTFICDCDRTGYIGDRCDISQGTCDPSATNCSLSSSGSAGSAAPPNGPMSGVSSAGARSSPGSATIGEVCEEQDVFACVVSRPLERVRCDGSTWVDAGDCPDGYDPSCASSPGPDGGACRYRTNGCDGAHIGNSLCVDNYVHTCLDAGGITQLVATCDGDTPDCMNGQCTCVTRCNAECRSLQWDARNCGACGHDCEDGECNAGVCKPHILVHRADAAQLLVDSRYMYWATTVGTSELSTSIFRAPLEGGRSFALATMAATLDYKIVSDEDYVYVSDGRQGTVTKYSVTDGAPIALASNQQGIHDLIADATNLYWTSGPPSNSASTVRSIYKMQKTGGAVVQLGQDPGASGLALDADYLYYSTSTVPEISRLSKNGGSPQRIPTKDWPAYLQVSDGYAYYEGAGAFQRVPVGGGAEEVLFDDAPAYLVDGSEIFLISSPGLQRFRIGVDKQPTVIRSDITNAIVFALDSRYVYVVGQLSSIVRIPRE